MTLGENSMLSIQNSGLRDIGSQDRDLSVSRNNLLMSSAQFAVAGTEDPLKT